LETCPTKDGQEAVMPLIPNTFLFRVAHPCRYVPDIPDDSDDLLELPESCRVGNFADMDDRRNFADVRLAWNEGGLTLLVTVRGKDRPPAGDAARPRHSDGVSLWVDTRDARASHRASRYCHQFHFLPAGGGADRDEPVFGQAKINRALADAPHAPAGAVPFRVRLRASGYRLAAWLPAGVVHGFDPEQNPRMGFFYAVRDAELGEQTLGVGSDFPYAEDPSLWGVLELVRGGGQT
jgi:hypothetical protein